MNNFGNPLEYNNFYKNSRERFSQVAINHNLLQNVAEEDLTLKQCKKRYVRSRMDDDRFRELFGSDIIKYFFNIAMFSLRGGMIYASEPLETFDDGEIEDRICDIGIDELSNPIFEKITDSQNTRNFLGAIFNEWQWNIRDYFDGSVDCKVRIEFSMNALFDVGVAIVRQNKIC